MRFIAGSAGSEKCRRCGVMNPGGSDRCGLCGHSFPQRRVKVSSSKRPDILESIAPRIPMPRPDAPATAALIGFGAVLSLATASYPWYAFGDNQAASSTLFQLLEVGWNSFPGLPLALIAGAAVKSALVSMVPELGRARAVIVVSAGLVALLSAAWLSQGFAQAQAGVMGVAEPATGATLVTIGGIVVIAAEVYLWNVQRTKTDASSGVHVEAPRLTS